MERSLYVTKGKEVLKMTDASEAFLGTGDLFEKTQQKYYLLIEVTEVLVVNMLV